MTMTKTTETPARLHELKTDPAVLTAVLAGAKTHEIRKNDRGFAVGDELLLRETKHDGAQMQMFPAMFPLEYTGRWLKRTVSHVLTGYGLQDGWCILSLAPTETPAALLSATELDKQRALFVAVETENGADLSKACGFGTKGEYANPAVDNRWKGWQAALIAQARAAVPVVANDEQVNAEFLSKRLERVAKLIGSHIPEHFSHAQVAEVAGTILGDVARKLEAAQARPAAAPAGEPLAWRFKSKGHRFWQTTGNAEVAASIGGANVEIVPLYAAPVAAAAPGGDAKDAALGKWLIEHGFKHANVDLTSNSDGDPVVIFHPYFYIPEPVGMSYDDGKWTVDDIRAALYAAMSAAPQGDRHEC